MYSTDTQYKNKRKLLLTIVTSSSAMAEGPRDALVSTD